MSNLKLVAGAVKRRGIAIAAAVAVAGGSLATANYAMAVEANEPTQQELEAEFLGTEAGNIAAETADEYNKALKSGATEDQLRQILENGLKSAAQADDAGFSAEDLAAYDKNKLNNELQDIVDSTKQSQEKEIPAQPENPAVKWATPTPEVSTLHSVWKLNSVEPTKEKQQKRLHASSPMLFAVAPLKLRFVNSLKSACWQPGSLKIRSVKFPTTN